MKEKNPFKILREAWDNFSDREKVFFVILSVFLIAVVWASFNPHSFYLTTGLPFTTFYELPSPEPAESDACRQLGGICININVGCSEDRFEYGSCKEQQICCLKDTCTTTGGRWSFEKVGPSSFSRKCLCPKPLEFNIQEGCMQVFQ